MNPIDEHVDDELKQMAESDRPEENIDKAITLDDPVSTLKLQETIIIADDALLHDAVELMKRKKTGCLLVTRDEKLVGIFTERDVVRKVVEQGLDWKQSVVRDYMTASPDTLEKSVPIAFALNRMAVGGYRHVPLVDVENRPQGFVSVRDIVNYIGEYFYAELANLPPKPQDDSWTTIEGG